VKEVKDGRKVESIPTGSEVSEGRAEGSEVKEGSSKAKEES
jgi:hypothetical protein